VKNVVCYMLAVGCFWESKRTIVGRNCKVYQQNSFDIAAPRRHMESRKY